MLKRGLGLKPFLLSSVSLAIRKAMFFLGSTIDSYDLRPIKTSTEFFTFVTHVHH